MFVNRPIVSRSTKILINASRLFIRLACGATVLIAASNCCGQSSSGSRVLTINDALLQIHERRAVPAQTTGLLRRLDVREGSVVSKGQLLAKLDSAEIELALEQSQVEFQAAKMRQESDIEVRYASKSKQVAVADLQRAHESNAKFPDVVPPKEMDRLTLTIEKHDAELEKAEFEKSLIEQQMQLARINQQRNELELNRHEVVAPIDGMIVEILKKDGEWLERSETVFRIIGLDRLRIEELVSYDVVQNGLLDKRAEFYLPQPNGADSIRFTGRVSYVSPEVNPVNGMVKIWVELENRDSLLLPGLRGKLEIHLD